MQVFNKNRTLSIESSHFSSFRNLDFYHLPLPTSLLPHSIMLETGPTCIQEQGNNAPLFEEKVPKIPGTEFVNTR